MTPQMHGTVACPVTWCEHVADVAMTVHVVPTREPREHPHRTVWKVATDETSLAALRDHMRTAHGMTVAEP